MILAHLTILFFLKCLILTSSQKIGERKDGLRQCSVNYPVKTGHIQERELVEASGIVASRRHPGVYYSIQDSFQPSNVYAFRYDGKRLGKNKITLQNNHIFIFSYFSNF